MYARWIKLLDMQATDLVSETPSLNPDQKRKNLELAAKLVAQVSVMKKELRHIQFGRVPVEMVIRQLHQIIEIKVSDATNPETRRILLEVFNELNRNIGNMPTEPNEEE